MKNVLSFTVFLCLFCHIPSRAQNSGEELFKSTCAACHTIGKGRMVGPDLTGIYDQKSAEWLVGFIRSSQTMIKAGDPDAVAIFNEYNKIPMPDNPFSDEQILGILDYIRSVDQGQPSDTTAAFPADTTGVAADTTGVAFTYDMVQLGAALYNGLMPFSERIAPCMSCHNIMGQSFLGGGKLAFDLTRSYTKLGSAGIQGILTNPPFPAMKAAMPGKLSGEEIDALVALMSSVDERFADYPDRTMAGLSFFIISFVIAILALAHIYLFYDNRKIPDNPPGVSG